MSTENIEQNLAKSAGQSEEKQLQAVSAMQFSNDQRAKSSSHFSSSLQNLSATQKCIYLQDLLRDRAQLDALPKGLFTRLALVLDKEVDAVRKELFSSDSRVLTRKHTSPDKNNNHSSTSAASSSPASASHSTNHHGHHHHHLHHSHHQHHHSQIDLPEFNPATDKITKKQSKIFMPVDKYPTFNFVGRIVGPRGRTIKEIEQKTGVKILVRGRGSMRNSAIEEMKRGKPNYEHLNETLHVILQSEDSEQRQAVRLQAAENEIMKLINPELENGRDDIKKKQLTELAILNGTYNPMGPIKQISPTQIIQAAPTAYQPAPQAHVLIDSTNHHQVINPYATPIIYTTAQPQPGPTAGYETAAMPVTTTAALNSTHTPIYYHHTTTHHQPTVTPQTQKGPGGGKVQPTNLRLLQKTTVTHSPY